MLAPVGSQAFEAKDLLAFSAGPFVIRPKLTASETYNDNLFYGGTGQQAAWITSVAPAVEVRLGRLDGNRVFRFKYDFNQYWYHDVEEIDTAVAHNLALTGTIRGDRLSSDTAFGVGFTDTVYGGYEGFQQGAVVGGSNVERMTLNLSQTLRYQLSEKSATYGRFTFNDLDFEESEVSTFYDQTTWRATGGFGYRVRPKVEIIAEMHYGQTSSDPNSDVREEPPRLETLGGAVGANLNFTSKLSGTAKVGYEQANADPDSQGVEVDFGTPIASVSLTSALSERSSSTLSYVRGTGASVQSGASVYTSDNFNLQFRHIFGTAHPWSVTAGGTYGLNTYESRTADNGTTVPEYDRNFLGVNASVVYQPRLWLNVGLYYRFSKSDGSSDLSGIDYTINEVTLGVSLGY